MNTRDKDISRIQEIRRMLESRQSFYEEKMNESLKKKGDGSTVLHLNRSDSPNEPSLGHSIEANFGSSSEVSCPAPQQKSLERDNSDSEESSNTEEEDPANYCADLSHNSTSAASSDEDPHKMEEKKKMVKMRRRRSQTGKVLGKWISKNVEHATWNNYLGTPDVTSHVKPLRKKSVTFDESLEEEMEEEQIEKERRLEQTKSPPVPLDLLRKQLKLEVAKKLDENAAHSSGLHLSRARILDVTNGSLLRAREKLEEAEKSLRNTVKTTENIPVKRVDYSVQLRRNSHQTILKPQHYQSKPLFTRKAISRLGIKNAEESIKSDLNLREAFAMIKIDPGPILDLAPASAVPVGKKSSENFIEDKIRSVGHSGHSSHVDDSEAARSLRRLTQLSVQHQKKQKSLIPESINAQIIMEDIKVQSRKLRGGGDGKTGSLTYLSPNRRQSSTGAGTGLGGQRHFTRKRSSTDFGNGPRLAFSGLEASLKAERGRSIAGSQDGDFLSGYHYVQKLSGTIL